jgi:hypothetical protein
MFLLLCAVAWLFAVGVGLRFLLEYENTSGQSGASPIERPVESRIARTPGLPTLVMMIHSDCPCSRASIGELALLMVQGRGLVNANVVFVKPAEFSEEWDRTDLWSSATMIPEVKVSVDDGGIEARRFGSETSGQVLLYGATGELLFAGGITAARGHSGDNEGRSAVVSLLTNGNAGIRETAVFGCSLFGEASNREAKEECHAIGGK